MQVKQVMQAMQVMQGSLGTRRSGCKYCKQGEERADVPAQVMQGSLGERRCTSASNASKLTCNLSPKLRLKLTKD